jgi:hypothetical protein
MDSEFESMIALNVYKEQASRVMQEAITKLKFSFEIKAKPRLNPQAYYSMSRT